MYIYFTLSIYALKLKYKFNNLPLLPTITFKSEKVISLQFYDSVKFNFLNYTLNTFKLYYFI
jgi:hypothetical protein